MAAYDLGSEPSALDMLKGLALVAAFVGCLSTCAALIAWWDSTWREAVSPVRIEVSVSFFEGSHTTPAALIFVVCHALADQGPLDVNGFPVDGVKLDYGTCRNELVQIFDKTEGQSTPQHPDLSNPNVCSRMSMSETAHWERDHPGWYVRMVKCPHPDGTFPGDTDV